MEGQLRDLVLRLGLNEQVKFCGSVSLDRIPDVIANADLGIVPKRADSFGNEAYSTKILEFMSQGVPVVVSRTKIDTYYFEDNVVRFFPSGDSVAMADAMLQVLVDQGLRNRLIERGYEYVNVNSWDDRRRAYFRLVDGLFAGVTPPEPQEVEVPRLPLLMDSIGSISSGVPSGRGPLQELGHVDPR